MNKLIVLLMLLLTACSLTPAEKTAIPAMLTALPDILTQVYAGEVTAIPPTSTNTSTSIPPTFTLIPPTNTVIIPTNTLIPPTKTNTPVTPTFTATVKPTPIPTVIPTIIPTVTFTSIPPITGASLYVDGTNGSDSNNGSLSAPYKTIQKAVGNVKPGGTIFVKAGTYNESVVISVTGTASAPITFTRYANDTVILNGDTNIALYTNSALAYWTIDGLTIKSTNRYTTRFGWWGGQATSNLTFKNNKIFGSNFMISSYSVWDNNDVSGVGYTATLGDAGIMDANTSHHNIIRNNNVHDFTSTDSRGIWTQGKTHDDLIENNIVTNIRAKSGIGQCIDLDGASNVEWRHIVRGNQVNGCNYVGIQLENVFASTIENNNLLNTGSAGIIVISYDSGVKCLQGGETGQYGDQNGDNNCQGDLTNNYIQNNTIKTDTYWGWGYGGIMNWYAGGLYILNNTLISANGYGNGSINFQGTAAQDRGGVLRNNIITTKGVAVCSQYSNTFLEDTNNPGIHKTGASCDQ